MVRKKWLPLAIIAVAATSAFFASRSTRVELPPELWFVLELHPRVSTFASAENGRLYPSVAYVFDAPAQPIAHRLKEAFVGRPDWQLLFPDASSYSARIEKLPLRPVSAYPWPQGCIEVVFFDEGGTNTAVQITDYRKRLNPFQVWIYRLTHHM